MGKNKTYKRCEEEEEKNETVAVWKELCHNSYEYVDNHRFAVLQSKPDKNISYEGPYVDMTMSSSHVLRHLSH